MPDDASREAGARAAVDVSRETRERLDRFATLLLRWNRVVNLIARADEKWVWSRHIADSAQLRALIPPGTSHAIDLGSGAGFPGLVLSLVADLPFALVEADARKAAFLREAARVTGAPVQVHASRIEDARIRPAPLVTARALAPLSEFLSLAVPLLCRGGSCLLPKGEAVETELTQARRQWHMRIDRVPSRTASGATILMISEIRPAGVSERGPD